MSGAFRILRDALTERLTWSWYDRRGIGQAMLFDERIEIAEVTREIFWPGGKIVPAAGITETDVKAPITGQ